MGAIQSQINKLIGMSAIALSTFGSKKQPEEKPEDAELKKAKTEYYKQKTESAKLNAEQRKQKAESAKLNDAYTKEATKFRKQRTKYQRLQNEYKQLKVDELKAKIERQKSQANVKAFQSAATNSMQAVSKKVENQNLVKQNLNNIASEQSPLIQTDGTTTNVPRSEEIQALEAAQERSWKRSVAASQRATTMWDQKRKAERIGAGSMEDVDNSYAFSGRTSENELKNFGLTKQQLRDWALSENPSKAAEEFEKFANSKGVYVAINSDEYDSMDKVGALIERTIRHDKVVNSARDWNIPEDYDETKDMHKVWPTEKPVEEGEIRL